MARKKLWTLETVAQNLTAASVNAQQTLTAELQLRLDRPAGSFKGFTPTRILGQGMVLNETSETSAAQGDLAHGIGVYNRNMDGGDFPDLRSHAGDWPWYMAVSFKGAGTGLTPVEPENARNFSVDMKSNRVLRADDDLFWVGRLGPLTAVDVTIAAKFSILWLLPD